MSLALRRVIAVAAVVGLAFYVTRSPAATGERGPGSARPAGSAPSYPAHLAAPYLQVDSADIGDMAADMKATGIKYFTLAFLTPKTACTPMWEDNNEAMGSFSSEVKSLQSAGGNVIISFGGASGGEIASRCKSTSKLEAAYQNVVKTYGVTRLDFDIEGYVANNQAATARRNKALAALQVADPAVEVDYTLPVNPSGLPASELALLSQARADGVKVTTVNIMTMDFGNGQDVLADAESAAKGTESQLAKIYTTLPSSKVWGMIGLTPIAGKNDDAEDFTLSDAKTLESFASSHGVGELAFWEVDSYDKPLGYEYSKVFNEITG